VARLDWSKDFSEPTFVPLTEATVPCEARSPTSGLVITMSSRSLLKPTGTAALAVAPRDDLFLVATSTSLLFCQVNKGFFRSDKWKPFLAVVWTLFLIWAIHNNLQIESGK
jgi:hypothetical protein